MAERGPAGVAVEPIARALGVTKGSFYWHFPDRAALVQAALARWERLATDDVIAALERDPDPRSRLRGLFHACFDVDKTQAVEVAIAAAADDPLVSPVLARVSARRLAYVVTLYDALGMKPAEARRWGTLAYTAYVGLLHVLRVSPDLYGTPAARRAYVRHVIDVLVPP